MQWEVQGEEIPGIVGTWPCSQGYHLCIYVSIYLPSYLPLFLALCPVHTLSCCRWVGTTLLGRGSRAWFRQFLVPSSQSSDISVLLRKPDTKFQGADYNELGWMHRHISSESLWPSRWRLRLTKSGSYAHPCGLKFGLAAHRSYKEEGVDHSPQRNNVLYQRKMGREMLNRRSGQVFITDPLCLQVWFCFPTNVSENREDFYSCKGKILLTEGIKSVQKKVAE